MAQLRVNRPRASVDVPALGTITLSLPQLLGYRTARCVLPGRGRRVQTRQGTLDAAALQRLREPFTGGGPLDAGLDRAA
jgi:hypothetical protein